MGQILLFYINVILVWGNMYHASCSNPVIIKTVTYTCVWCSSFIATSNRSQRTHSLFVFLNFIFFGEQVICWPCWHFSFCLFLLTSFSFVYIYSNFFWRTRLSAVPGCDPATPGWHCSFFIFFFFAHFFFFCFSISHYLSSNHAVSPVTSFHTYFFYHL